MSVGLEFRWIAWNIAKCQGHGVEPTEAQDVVDGARRPYPRSIDNAKILVRGQTAAGRFLQVIYLLDEDDVVFVIHARPLTDNEKRQLRRSLR
jgi:uncharacterized DUF497 family protein